MNEPRFDGDTYDSKYDLTRLTGQIQRIFEAIKDGNWYTLDEIHKATKDPHASISAQLRNLRKKRFGSHVIEKRYKGNRSNGLWEYSLKI